MVRLSECSVGQLMNISPALELVALLCSLKALLEGTNVLAARQKMGQIQPSVLERIHACICTLQGYVQFVSQSLAVNCLAEVVMLLKLQGAEGRPEREEPDTGNSVFEALSELAMSVLL